MKRLPVLLAALAASTLLMSGPANASSVIATRLDAPAQAVSSAFPISGTSDLFEQLGEAAEDGDVEAAP